MASSAGHSDVPSAIVPDRAAVAARLVFSAPLPRTFMVSLTSYRVALLCAPAIPGGAEQHDTGP